MTKKVENGNTVVVEYTGKFEDGTVFDTSKGKKPIEFKTGAGQVVKGFDEAVIGMKKGEEKKIKLKPEDAFGQRDEKLVQRVPKRIFPKNMELKKGTRLKLQSPEGQIILANVTKVEQEHVTVDFNHPLAGKNLDFDIKVLDIK
jgi:peptidylprolyl isomerase